MNSWIAAFVGTVAVEVAVAVPLLGALGSSAGALRRAGAVVLASAVTHPLLWLLVGGADGSQAQWTVALLGGEAVAVAVEAAVLIVALPGPRPDRRQRALVAVLMNAVSALLGLVLIAVD